MGALLRLRGLTDVVVETSSSAVEQALGKNIDAMVERLQVLKQPHFATDLEKLAKKNFSQVIA